MQARMANTFGNLSAVRDYTPLEKSQAPVPNGPYTGPVTHAISNATPSPSVAGPMQAQRDGGSKKTAPKKKSAPKPKKKAASKPKKNTAPVMASYRDLEDVRDYDEDTKRISIYDDGASELREDEDTDWVSPELMRSYQSRNNKMADELFHVGAGILADDERKGIEKKKIMDTMKPIFYQEELKKGNEYAMEEADDRARKYAQKNKPKFDPTISKQERSWFDNSTRDPSLDLYRTLYNRKMKAARNLIAYRENMGKLRTGEDKDKLDFEASFSEDARNLNVYDMILSSMSMTQASMELQKEQLAKGESQGDFDVLDWGQKLATASSTGKYAKTEEGKAHLPLFQQMNIQALQGTYQSRKDLMKKKTKR